MNNQKGNILITLLIGLIILSILSIAAYRISYSASRESLFTHYNAQAQYIAKAGADIVIDNIGIIKEEMENQNQTEESFNVQFSDRDRATIDIKLDDDNNIIINSIGIVNEQKYNKSKSRIQARLKFKACSNDRIIFGIDRNGNIYEFDKDLEGYNKLDIRDKTNRTINIENPSGFAWNGKDTLILVGGESGNKVDTLIYNIPEGCWRKPKGKANGNGFKHIVYSEEKDLFYALNTNNDKINYFNKDEEWEDIHKPTSGFKAEKLAQGNNTLIGISTQYDDYVAYKLKDNGWKKNYTGINGTYNGITYGNGKFVIVGSDSADNINGHPIIIYSDDGTRWQRGNVKSMGTGYPLYEITWTGEKFIAVGGANTIYSSQDGVNWYRFLRENIIPVKGSKYYYDYKYISSSGNYIIAYSENGNGFLLSKDGGNSWEQRIDSNYPKLIDIEVINKVKRDFDYKNYDIYWSKG
ncbi:hypothetical protein [Clostridium sp. Cult3]|uniref:hypothetical protein n=1 Tax=Clostridium sp. Cult3 TaxID=2079004 RepID=UPI001F1CC6D6|nr:hypothetical protein [Clostridium sp. Cult3]MCF6460069.1 hypothetical protein [Clostridium sp. Cult3]